MFLGWNSFSKVSVCRCVDVNVMVMRSPGSGMSSDDLPRRAFISVVVMFDYTHCAIHWVIVAGVIFTILLASSTFSLLVFIFFASICCLLLGTCFSEIVRFFFIGTSSGAGCFGDGDIVMGLQSLMFSSQAYCIATSASNASCTVGLAGIFSNSFLHSSTVSSV